MAQTHDAIDGLLAEFRGYAAGMPPSYHVTMSWHDFNRMLDRFDAAHKRERGNSAALREAASYLTSIFSCDIQFLERHAKELRDTGAYGGGIIEHILHSITLARAALAAPPRNCDLTKVTEDPWRAWLDDKSNWDEFGSPKLEIHDWLLAPATEKEGANDGNE